MMGAGWCLHGFMIDLVQNEAVFCYISQLYKIKKFLNSYGAGYRYF